MLHKLLLMLLLAKRFRTTSTRTKLTALLTLRNALLMPHKLLLMQLQYRAIQDDVDANESDSADAADSALQGQYHVQRRRHCCFARCGARCRDRLQGPTTEISDALQMPM